MNDPALYVSGATVVAVIGYAVKLTWKFRDLEKEMRKDSDAKIEKIKDDYDKAVREHMGDLETMRHEFGETVAAVRTKIHDVEMWNRDTFVRKDSFEMVIGRLEKSIEKLGDKIEDRIDKMVERISIKAGGE